MMMKTEFASNDEPRCSQEQSSPTIIITFPTTNIAPKREGRVGLKRTALLACLSQQATVIQICSCEIFIIMISQ